MLLAIQLSPSLPTLYNSNKMESLLNSHKCANVYFQVSFFSAPLSTLLNLEVHNSGDTVTSPTVGINIEASYFSSIKFKEKTLFGQIIIFVTLNYS